jgi:hypothetical protein
VLNRIWVGDMRADLVEQARVWPTRVRAKIEVGAWNALRKPAGELFLRRAPVRTFGPRQGSRFRLFGRLPHLGHNCLCSISCKIRV